MSAVRYQILKEIIRILQEEVSWEIDADVDAGIASPLPTQNILIQKVQLERDTNKGQTAKNFPMCLVCCPFSEPFQPSAGETAHDIYPYSFLLQIIDSDNYQYTDKLATYWLWQQNVTRKFQFKCLTDSGNIDVVPTGSYFIQSIAANCDVVDERYWIRDANFKAGIKLVVNTFMTRNN